ncbi:MAG: hypothetical protein HY698_19960 [Deltaproteobacteria bacterium]|nr:hypothetical protein [Deltaproteobacteria bacterium]
MSEIALFSWKVRGTLMALAGLLVLLVVVLRLRRAKGYLLAWATAGMLLGLAVLGGERVVALLVTSVAPEDAQFNEWRWVLLSPWGWLGISLGATACMATVVLAFVGTRGARSPLRRGLMVGARAGAAVSALVLFLEPALELRHVTREPNHVVVLVDDSRSMALAEDARGPTRAQRAASLLARSRATFDSWTGEHHVDFFTFSDTVTPATFKQLSSKVEPRADATLMREALEGIRARYEGADLAGIVLVSDGVPTGRFADGVGDGGSKDFLSSLQARVHAAWVGRTGLKDLAVLRVESDELAFVRTVFKVEAVVRATGLGAQDVPVSLKRDGQVIKQAHVQVGGDTPLARVVFEIVPERVGKYFYEVSLPVFEEESVPTNNVRGFVLRVIRDKIRVLQVAGRPSWDERALRALLKADPNVDLISFFILRTPDDIQLVPSSEMSLIPFPTQELFEEELGSFDVVVLMNFEYGPYQIGPYLDNIRKYVEDGGGLAMVGGDLSFSSGDYLGTPVADVLPVELFPASAGPSVLLSTDEFHPRLTPEGQRHPVTQLRFGRRDNEARWASLPSLEGVNQVAGAKPGAIVLAVHPNLRANRGEPMPVIAVSEHGKGRSFALTTDTAWRWGFVAAGRDGDDGRAFQKLWENVIRWLIRDPDLEYLHLEADVTESVQGEAPRLTARLVDKDYQPAKSAAIRVVVERKENSPKVILDKKFTTDEAGETQVELPPLPEGAYQARARATVGDRQVVVEEIFLVHPEREELENPAAREDILEGISAQTGGDYVGAASSLPASIPLAAPRIVRVDRKTDVELWSRPYLFILALALLAMEWSLRRRSGYL